MKRVILVIYALLTLSLLSAQKHDYVWQLGGLGNPPYGAFQMDFNTSPINISTCNRTIRMFRMPISTCDANGNYLFSSNGFKVCDVTGGVMQNGDSLHGGDFYSIWAEEGNPQPNYGLVLPSPTNNGEYYLFNVYTTWGPAYPAGLVYSKINMNLNNGLGAVTDKNVFVIQDSVEYSSLSAVKHGNGRDWWVILPEKNGQYIYTVLLTPSGIKQVKKEKTQDIPRQFAIYTTFTPDGTKCIQYLRYFIRVMDFNRCEGAFGDIAFINTSPATPYNITIGLSVSPNSRVLYRVTGDTIFQYDLWANDISASEQIIGYLDGFLDAGNQPVTYSGSPQLAPNGKIYISSPNKPYYHVIESPDSLGIACNFIQHISLPAIVQQAFPHFPNYRLGAAIGSGCDTLALSNQLAVNSKQIKVYPNPAQNYVQVELPQDIREATFVLRNALGQVVQQTGLQASTLVPLAYLAKGLYFYEVIFKEGESYGKLQVE